MSEGHYHLSVKPVQRSKGRAATAAAAYRSGECIRDERQGLTHDYRKRSGVDRTFMVGWEGSRSALWNAAEAAERRRDGTTAREYEVGLPADLDPEDQVALAGEFGRWLRERYGVAVDVAIHDQGSQNPHAHILTTTRRVDGGQLTEKAEVEWSDKRRKQHGMDGRKAELGRVREQWAEMANEALAAAQADTRIDHRSYAERGIDREPRVHLGPYAYRMAAQASNYEELPERAKEDVMIVSRNQHRDQMAAELAELDREIAQAEAEAEAEEDAMTEPEYTPDEEAEADLARDILSQAPEASEEKTPGLGELVPNRDQWELQLNPGALDRFRGQDEKAPEPEPGPEAGGDDRGPEGDRPEPAPRPQPTLGRIFDADDRGRVTWRNRPQVQAMSDEGSRITVYAADSNTAMKAEAFAEMAAERWESVELWGSEEWLQAAWMECALRGLAVEGYEPTQADLDALEDRGGDPDAADPGVRM